MSTPQPNDKPAAFRGLIVTAILLFVMAYAIVLWTNSRFAGHSEAAPAAQR
jgi:hypothetical protein